MALRRTKADIIEDMVDYIIANRPDVNVSPGETLRDVVISAPASEFEKFYILLEHVEGLTTIEGLRELIESSAFQERFRLALGRNSSNQEYTIADVQEILSQDVDRLVGNWGITRKPGTYATGKIRLYTTSQTTVTVPNGSKVRTLGAEYLEYEILGSLTNYPVTELDTTMGMYYVEVPIRATAIGTSYNVSAGLITQVSPPIPNIVSCSNPSPTTGGTDEESDLDLLTRAETAQSGRNLSTVDGYKQFAEDQDYVVEAVVYDPASEYLYRESAGVVDVWIRCSDSTIDRAQIITGDGLTAQFLLSYQPVHSYIGATGASEPYAVTLSEDIATLYTVMHSTKAQTYAVFATPPADGEEVTLMYRQYADVYTLQTLLDTDENRVAMGDVLVKRAQPRVVDVRMDLTTLSGYSEASVKADIVKALTVFFNGGQVASGTYERVRINERIQVTDLYEVAAAVEGVNSIDLDTFAARSDNGAWTDTWIENSPYTYATFGDVTWLTSS